jgi:hypothetical protein
LLRHHLPIFGGSGHCLQVSAALEFALDDGNKEASRREPCTPDAERHCDCGVAEYLDRSARAPPCLSPNLALTTVTPGLWYKWQLEPVDTRLQTVQVEDLEYPTVIAVNPSKILWDSTSRPDPPWRVPRSVTRCGTSTWPRVHTASTSSAPGIRCKRHTATPSTLTYGLTLPWGSQKGQDNPSPGEAKAKKCLPVSRIVFFEPAGPRYCLKYQAPDNWRVQKSDGLAILKASIELLGPNGEEHYLPSEGLSLFVLSTSDWERAVFRYNKQGGNGTDFLKLFDDITQAQPTP